MPLESEWDAEADAVLLGSTALNGIARKIGNGYIITWDAEALQDWTIQVALKDVKLWTVSSKAKSALEASGKHRMSSDSESTSRGGRGSRSQPRTKRRAHSGKGPQAQQRVAGKPGEGMRS